MSDDEMTILSRYVRTRDEAAFRGLVDRYINIVYSAAKRQTGDPHLAEDVTQAVFILLASKAPQIPADRPISAWLLRTTAYCASNARRQRDRRLALERRAAAMTQSTNDHSSDENALEPMVPMLDEGLNRLRAKDRDLLLWRFFEGRSIAQIATMLGVSEDAATKRISRAVEQLRQFFHRRGATVSAGAIGAFLLSQTSEAAPPALVSAVSAGAAPPIAASLAKGALIMAATTKIKVAAVAAVVFVAGIGGGVAALKYASAPSAPPISTAAEVIADTTVTGANGAIAFTDGTVFEVLGMRDEQSQDGKWWRADGLEIPAPGHRDNLRQTVFGIGTRQVRFTLRMSGASVSDKNLRVDVTPSMSKATSTSTEGNAFMMNMTVAVPQAADTVTLRVGMAGGEWTDTVIFDSGSFSDAPLRVGTITEENGKTIVQVFDSRWSKPDREESVVVLAGGKMISASQSRNSLTSGASFTFNCTKDQVTSVIFRWRPYEFAQMTNVSVRPTTMPTDVQIAKIESPTTAPQVKEATP